MDHIHWSGVATDIVEYQGQQIEVGFSENPEDPIGTVVVATPGFVSAKLALPNSTSTVPTWSPVPGTSPTLEVRQDGHFPTTYLLIRAAA